MSCKHIKTGSSCSTSNVESEQTKKKQKCSPEGEEANYRHGNEQLHHEDGVHLQKETHGDTTVTWARGMRRLSYLPDERPPDGLIVPGELGLHLPVACSGTETEDTASWNQVWLQSFLKHLVLLTCCCLLIGRGLVGVAHLLGWSCD